MDFQIKDKSNLKGEVIIPVGTKEIFFMEYFNCQEITSVIIPEGVEFIGWRAFEHCTKLKSVKLPGTIKKIYRSAFLGCTQLSSINLPDSIQEIDNYAFQNCNIENVNHDCLKIKDGFAIENNMLQYYSCQKPEVIIPDGVKVIHRNAFLNCKNIKNIFIPGNVKRIGPRVFDSCTSLETVVFSEGVEYFYTIAFIGCKKLSAIFIPKSVKSIDNSENVFFKTRTTLHYLQQPLTINYAGTKEQWKNFGLEFAANITVNFEVQYCK